MNNTDWSRQLDELSASVETHRRRSIQRVVANVTDATIEVTLGCSHTLKFTIAGHPVLHIEHGFFVGDEMDCDQCAPPVVTPQA